MGLLVAVGPPCAGVVFLLATRVFSGWPCASSPPRGPGPPEGDGDAQGVEAAPGRRTGAGEAPHWMPWPEGRGAPAACWGTGSCARRRRAWPAFSLLPDLLRPSAILPLGRGVVFPAQFVVVRFPFAAVDYRRTAGHRKGPAFAGPRGLFVSLVMRSRVESQSDPCGSPGEISLPVW